MQEGIGKKWNVNKLNTDRNWRHRKYKYIGNLHKSYYNSILMFDF